MSESLSLQPSRPPAIPRRAGGKRAGQPPTLAQPATAPSATGHRRLSFGSHDLVVLSDGHLLAPTRVLAGNVPPAELTSFLAGRGVGLERVQFHLNVALVKTGNAHVLIDAGAGGTWEPTAGRLADSLEAALGVKPDEIGTRRFDPRPPRSQHPGLIDELDSSLRFPQAQYLVSAGSSSFGRGRRRQASRDPSRGSPQEQDASSRPSKSARRASAPRRRNLAWIVAIDSAGHTPGHISLFSPSCSPPAQSGFSSHGRRRPKQSCRHGASGLAASRGYG